MLIFERSLSASAPFASDHTSTQATLTVKSPHPNAFYFHVCALNAQTDPLPTNLVLGDAMSFPYQLTGQSLLASSSIHPIAS